MTNNSVEVVSGIGVRRGANEGVVGTKSCPHITHHLWSVYFESAGFTTRDYDWIFNHCGDLVVRMEAKELNAKIEWEMFDLEGTDCCSLPFAVLAEGSVRARRDRDVPHELGIVK